MSIKGLIGYSLTAGATGAIGGFFAPQTAAAAGGILNVAGACAIGAPLAAIPTGIGMLAGGSLYAIGETTKNPTTKAVGGVITAASFASTVLLTAKIGAAIIGVSASAVLTCHLIGLASILLLGALATLPFIAGAATVMDGLAPGSLSR